MFSRNPAGMRSSSEPPGWRSVASRFLECADIHLVRVATGGFSEAIVLQLECRAERFALRCWPRDSWPIGRVLERHRWLGHLNAAGIPVAVPLPANDSFESVIAEGNYEWQLEPWVPGSSVLPDEMNPARWRSLMQLLAKMHLASATFVTSERGKNWFAVGHRASPAISERRQIIADWSPPKLMRAYDQLGRESNAFASLATDILAGFLKHSKRIDQELASLEQAAVPLFPCFRDLWREHVLLDGDEVTGFIDPTAARTDHVSSDLSRLLGSFLGDNRAGWNEAFAEYESIRPLTQVDHQLIQALDRSSVLLSGMTWILRWFEGTISSLQLEDITERMRAIALRVERL